LEFFGEQADFPAEQPSASQDARISPAHADARGPCDSLGASRQGPQPAVGLSRAPVLPHQARLRSRAEFAEITRRGTRAGAPDLVVYLRTGDSSASTRAGFVVSRAVGSAVIRNRVRRQLRHLVRDRLDRVPAGSGLVVRATPSAAAATPAALAAQLDAALQRLVMPVPAR
jgi:ribonuclease P protein component